MSKNRCQLGFTLFGSNVVLRFLSNHFDTAGVTITKQSLQCSFKGKHSEIYLFGGICKNPLILALNRRQGLHHSATGISHHEIDARERMHATNAEVEIERIRQAGEVAKHAIDSTSQLMQKRWQIESGKDAE